MSKVNCFLVICLVLGVLGTANAVLKQPSFTNNDGDQMWDNSANWSMGEVPGDSVGDTYDAWLSSNGSRAIIDSAVPDIGRIRVGQWGNYGELEIRAGGSLSIKDQGGQANGEMTIGLGSGGGGTLGGGKLFMTGGTLNIYSNLELGISGGFGSQIYMSGGTLTFNIDGDGTLYISDNTSFIDIIGGTIIWSGDHVTEAEGFVAAGKIMCSSGEVNCTLVGGDTHITAVITTTGPVTNPNPEDGAKQVETASSLSWNAGATAVSYNIYIGTDYDSVLNATVASAEYMDNVTTTSYSPSLNKAVIYYWRVDSVEASSNVIKGDVWSFATKADENRFDNFFGDGDNLWSSDENWNLGEAPDATHDAGIIVGGDNHCIIDSSTSAEVFRLRVGVSANTASRLTVQGGSLHVLTDTYIGLWSGCNASNIIVESGTVDIDGDFHIGYKSSLCYLKLHGGTFTVNGELTLNSNNTTRSYIELSNDGKLVLTGDRVDFVNDLIANEELFSLRGDVAVALAGGNTEVTTVYDPGQAYLPTPADRAVDQSVDAITLSWIAGDDAVSHELYFGTSYDDVLNSTSAAYTGGPNEFEVTNLDYGQTYYWRVDEVLSDTSVVAGKVWRFTTFVCGSIQQVWQYDSVPNTWDTAEAWSLGVLPTSCSDVTIVTDGNSVNGTEICVVPSGILAEAYDVKVGEIVLFEDSPGEFTYIMSPAGLQVEGSLTTTEDVIVGVTNGVDGSFVLIDGGQVNIGGDLEIDYMSNNCFVEVLSGSCVINGQIKFGTGGARGGFINIEDGSVTLAGDQVAAVNNMISASQILAFGGSGDVVVQLVSGDTVVTANAGSSKSYQPYPAHNQKDVYGLGALDWLGGSSTTSYRVFMSTNYNDVLNASDSGSPAYKATVSIPSYAPGTLQTNTWYYWKISSYNGSVWTAGEVWAFKTSTRTGNKILNNWLATIDNDWGNPDNWNKFVVPGANDDAAAIKKENQRCEFDGYTTLINKLRVGVVSNAESELLIKSGSLEVGTATIIGFWWNCSGSFLTVEGGELVVGGDLNVGYRSNNCHLDIVGGQVYVDDVLTINGCGGTAGYINVEDGKLVLRGDRTKLVDSLVSSNQIISFGGLRSVLATVEDGNTVVEAMWGDLNNDGMVDVFDLEIFASQWLTDGDSTTSADFDSNEIVDFCDYQRFAKGWQNN